MVGKLSSPVTSKDANILFILAASNSNLASREISELNEDDDDELDKVQYFLRKLQKHGYVEKLGRSVNTKYRLTTAGKTVVEKIISGEMKLRGSFRAPMSSLGTCEVCGEENCNRTLFRSNGILKSLCRDCLCVENQEDTFNGWTCSALSECERIHGYL